jgi:hypothetical protein
MVFRRIFCIIIVQCILLSIATGQTIVRPNYSLKSHETLEINKIENTPGESVFHMSIENRTSGGYFCADRNIFILYPDGSRIKLNSSNGIPVCPDTYKFRRIGERLDFTLIFPSIMEETEWIDLIEDCTDNCFSFYGVTLDTGLNKRIDDAFHLAEEDEPDKALASLISIVEETDSRNLGIEGLLYINIIRLARDTNKSGTASEWYQRMRLSGAPRLAQYIKYLNDQGIVY